MMPTRRESMRRMAVMAIALVLLAAVVSARQTASDHADWIFEAIGIAEGQTICEIGAGNGALSLAAARRVGESGRVYTSELGEERLAALRKAVSATGLSQITVIDGQPAATGFPDAACDGLFIRNVYHHFADPERMNASIFASMKPGARLAVVDFPPTGGEASRPADRDEGAAHGVTPETLSRELRAAGFELLRTERSDGRWFLVVVEKPRGSNGGGL